MEKENQPLTELAFLPKFLRLPCNLRLLSYKISSIKACSFENLFQAYQKLNKFYTIFIFESLRIQTEIYILKLVKLTYLSKFSVS